MRLSVPYLEGRTPAYPPGGPASADRPRRTSRAHLQLTCDQLSRDAFNATNSKYTKPSFFPSLFYRQRINLNSTIQAPQTTRTNTQASQNSPHVRGPFVRPFPARPQLSHEQSNENQEQTPTRTLNSPSPAKYQGSQELQKQARWRHQDDTKATPNAHPTIRLGTWFVPSAFLGHPHTHRGHTHTHSSTSSTAEHGNRTPGPRHTAPTGKRRQQANHD